MLLCFLICVLSTCAHKRVSRALYLIADYQVTPKASNRNCASSNFTVPPHEQKPQQSGNIIQYIVYTCTSLLYSGCERKCTGRDRNLSFCQQLLKSRGNMHDRKDSPRIHRAAYPSDWL